MSRFIQRIKNLYHLFQAVLTNLWYGFPSRKLKVIGVTGTDGKTTTTHLIYHILKATGKKVSMISTVYSKIGEEEHSLGFHITTPNSFTIQRLLKKSVENEDEFFVLETTSHALDQNRVWGINFEVGVLTNVTHEHLDYHQNYQDYLEKKLKLLLISKTSVINVDDRSYKYITQNLKLKTITYGYKNKADYKIDFDLKLTDYNKYNYLAAYSVCRVLNITKKAILGAMKDFKLPPGRLDIIYDKEFKVIIDFAHTPNAIENVLSSLRERYPQSKIIHVFGSAGLRDFTKRPLMGEASGKYSDLVILTEEDCRTEDPVEICLSITQGLKKQNFKKARIDLSINRYKMFDIIINREEAIKRAIQIAKKENIVILTGKGHEKSLCRGKKEWPWDEKEAVKKAIIINSKS